MAQYEYLLIKLMGSQGCINPDSPMEMSWNNLRLLITENGVTTVQNLGGGIEKMEEHLNQMISSYKLQGWQTIKVEMPQEKSQSRYIKNTIHCLLKRSIRLEPSDRFNQLSKNPTKIYQELAVGV